LKTPRAQADVLLHRLHYALPGWDGAAERRDAQDELRSAAQARACFKNMGGLFVACFKNLKAKKDKKFLLNQ
jgi:hypothetical protein